MLRVKGEIEGGEMESGLEKEEVETVVMRSSA